MSSSAVAFLIREVDKKGLAIRADWPRYVPKIVVRETLSEDWQEAAGSMAKSMEEMFWVFRWGVKGKLSGHDFLACNVCDEVQMMPKAKGAPSQKPVCHSTPGCTGLYRRLPGIFLVEDHPTPWRGVTWTFDDDGTVITTEMGKGNKTAIIRPIPRSLYEFVDGTSQVTVSFKTKQSVSNFGTTIVRSKDGQVSWAPIKWYDKEMLQDLARDELLEIANAA